MSGEFKVKITGCTTQRAPWYTDQIGNEVECYLVDSHGYWTRRGDEIAKVIALSDAERVYVTPPPTPSAPA
jgi:hypothetical protein